MSQKEPGYNSLPIILPTIPPAEQDRPTFDENDISLSNLGKCFSYWLIDDDLQDHTLNTTRICCLINRVSQPSSSFTIQIEIILHLELAGNDY
jgi:hypothetical protein